MDIINLINKTMNEIIYLVAMVIVTIAIAILAKTIVRNHNKHEQDILYLDKERAALWSKLKELDNLKLDHEWLKRQVKELGGIIANQGKETEELKDQVLKYMPIEDFLTKIENEVQRQKQITEKANNNKD